MLRKLKISARRIWLKSRAARNSGRKPRKAKAFILCLFLLLIVGTLFLLFETKLSPVVERVAIARVVYLAGKVINDAINDQISAGSISYDNFISLEKDTNGKITALKTNMIEVNRFKSEVTALVLEKISSLDAAELKIPLGNIINGELFSGRGPKISVIVIPIGSADVAFSSEFITAGINQTRHRLSVTVSAYVTVLLPGTTSSTTVSSQVNIAETIIVGEVPQAYTYLEDTGQNGMDIYGNFDLDGDVGN